MVILGVGTNVGDRLAHLRRALQAIKHIPQLTVQQVSPVYLSDALLPDNAPRHWDKPYLNYAVRCETSLNPYELLSILKSIEQQLGRVPEKDWGPRVIDIDLLAWDNLIQYDAKLHIPHEHLHERPFALWPLADVAPHWIYPLPGVWFGKTAIELASQWGPRHHHYAPLHIQQIQQRVDTPALMGIVNITPDSFSQDGLLDDTSSRGLTSFVTDFRETAVNPEHPVILSAAKDDRSTFALKQIHHLITSGAEIIDLGAEATGPAATSINAETEWQRLEPVLHVILREKSTMPIPPKISIDTRHAEVAKRALALGVDWINDVSGLDDPAMREIVAQQTCDIVFMHHLGIPVDKTTILPLNENSIALVYKAAEKRLRELEQSGIARDRLIFDVGIGYGKTAEQSLALIKQISEFRSLGVRLLVGHSRKSFLSQFTHLPSSERDWETMIISQYLAQQNVDYLRVHNIDIHARGLKIAAALEVI